MAAASGTKREGTAEQRWPRARRVRKRREYLAVQNEGRRLNGTHYMVFVRPASDAAAAARFGITVSRKVGGSVQRSQVKRWVRESCRRMKDEVPPGLDIVVVARPSAASAGYEPTARELATLARRLRGK